MSMAAPKKRHTFGGRISSVSANWQADKVSQDDQSQFFVFAVPRRLRSPRPAGG
jgi:hypothetical protein